MKKYPVVPYLNKGDRTMFSGLMAVSLASLAILAGKTEPDRAILVGIYAFAVAIPALAFCSERVRIDSQSRIRTHSGWIDLTEATGIFGALIGFGAIFWHFSIPAAIVYGIACFLASALLTWYEDKMQALNPTAPPDTRKTD